MKHLLTAWDEIAIRLARAGSIVVASDFDGTLTSIQESPDAVSLPERARNVLGRLAQTRNATVVIVTGRSLADIERRAMIPGVILIGNHGYEVYVPGKPPERSYAAAERMAVARVAKAVEPLLRVTPGLFIEDKGPIVSVHYRRVPPTAVPHLLDKINEVAMAAWPSVDVVAGKQVVEFRPARAVNKGQTLLRVLRYNGIPPDALFCYFGDDATDEDVFLALPHDSVTVHVGDAADDSAATYVVASPDEVLHALDRIAGVRGEVHGMAKRER